MEHLGISVFLMSIFSVLLASSLATTSDQYYTAAVYEHARFWDKKEPAKLVKERNLAFYKKATEVAKSKGADIIVFPEYGLFPPFQTRKPLKEYLETTPDPKQVYTNPCVEREAYSQRPILHTLSCMARNNSIVVVANAGDIHSCEGETDCPTDGVFQFNTNIVFDRDGTLLVRYHKEHLYFELGMDLAREQQNSTFKTDFGIFATYICFDILFGRMGDVAQWPNVDGIAFSTQWVEKPPQLMSVQFWEAWALGNNATLLSANGHLPGWYAIGSGVFHGETGALGYTYNPDGISKVVVARVPKAGYRGIPPNASISAITATDSWDLKNDGKDVPDKCMTQWPDNSTNIYTDYHCDPENTKNYTLVKLTKPSGLIEACNNELCCSLDYTSINLNESFYLGVFNGTYNAYNRYHWCDESCVLIRCEGPEDDPCSIYPQRSETLFQHVHLTGKFSTKSVYPSVLESGVRLTPRSEWTHSMSHTIPYDVQVHFENLQGRKLTAVGLKGRCYDRDPPYVR